MNRRQHIRRLRNYRSQWPHMSSLYSGGTSREDEEQKYVDPVMVFDNVYENPADPYGAYKFYMAPREEFVIQSEPHLYPVRAVYKEDDDRTSGYATSGGSSTLRDGSSKRILLCVLLIFLLIGAVIAAVVMAVLISHQRRIKPLQPELQQEDVLESNIRIGNRTYILEYSDPNSQEYKLLETEFCEGIDAMFYRIDSPLKTEYKGCKVLSFRNGSVIARNLMTFLRKDMKPTQAVKDEVYNFLKETIPKKGIWNPLLLNAESLDIYPVEMINIKPEVDPNYVKPTEDDVSEKSSIHSVSEYVKTKEHTPSSSVLTFQESKQTFPVSDSRDKVHLFSTLGDKGQLYPSQSLHQLIESLSPVHSSKVLSHSTDKLLPSLDYSTGLNPSSTLSPGATHSDIFPQISNIPFDSVRANIDMHLQSLLHFLPMDQQVRTPSKSLHLDSTSRINNDFFNFLNSVPSSHQMQPKSSVGRDQMNINDLDLLLATGDFNKVLFPTSASPVLDETQASVKSQGDLPVYGTSLTKHLLSNTMDQLSSSSLNLDGFFLQSSNLVFPSERFGQTKSTSVLSSLSSSTPPISSIINDMDMFFNNLLPSIPSIKDSSIVSSGTFEQNSNAQLITSSMSQSDSMNFDVTPSDLFDWSDYDIFSGFNQVTTPPSTSTGFSNDLFGNIQESVADDTQSFFDFFSHTSTKEESSNDGLPENVLMNTAQSGTASSSSPTQDLGMNSDQSMFSFLNNVPKGSNKVVDEFDTATHDSIDYDNSLLFQTRSGNKQSLSTTEPFEASQHFSNSLQPSLSRFITEKSDELRQQSIQSLDSSSVLKSLAHENLPSPTVEGIKPTTEVTENQSSLKIDLNTDNVKFGGSIQSTDIFVPASSIEMSSLMDGILPTENKVDEILLSSSQREMMSAHLSLKTFELSSRNYFSSENLFPNSDGSILEWNKSSVINTDYISSFSEAYTERFLPLTALPGEQIISSAQKIIDSTMKDAFSISDKKILPTMSSANEIYFTTKGETMSLDYFNSVDESSAHNLMMQSSFLQPASLSKSEKYAFSVNSLRDTSSDDVNSIWGSSIIPLLVQPTKTSTLPLSMEASLNEILEPITLNSQINTTDRQTASREQTNARSSITNEPALFSSLKEDSIQETRLQFNTDEFINPTSASVYIQSSLSEKEGYSDILLSASGTLQLTQSFVDSVIVTQKTLEKQTSLSFENLVTMSPFDTNINKASLNIYTEMETMEFSSGYISSSEKAMTSMLNPLLNPESVVPSSHIMSFNSIDNSVPHLEHESLAETSLIQPSEKSLSSSLRFSSPDVLDFSINDMVSEVASTSMFSSGPVTQHISIKSQISPSEENLIKSVTSKEHIPTETLMFSKEMTPSVEALESLATFTSFSDDSFMKSMAVLDSQSNILQNDITSLPKHEIKNSNIDIALSSLKSQTTEIETSIQSNVMTNTRSSISPSATDIEYESVMSEGILSKNMFYTTIKSDSLQINDLTNSLMPTETLAFQVETTFTDITDSKSISKDAPLSSFTKIKSSDDFLPVQTISSPTQTISIESVLADFKSSPSINKETAALSNHFENFDHLQASLDITSSQSYKQNGHTTVISDSLPMFDQTTSMSLNNQDQRLSSARRLSKITEIVDSKTILLDTNSEIMLQSSLSSKMKSLSFNIEKQLESMTSTMQPMPERFIKSHSTSTVESQQLEVVNTFYNSDITDTSFKLFPDSSFTGIIQSSSMVWSEKVALDSSDMSSTLSDMEIVNSLKPTNTEYILASSATAPLSNTADQEIMTNLLLDQSTLIMDLSSAIEYSKDTKDIFEVFSSSQSTMKLSTGDIIESSVMKQIDEITSEIKQTPLHGQIITTNDFNLQTFEFSKIETVQDGRLSTDALTLLNDGTVFSNMMSSDLITIEHSSQTVSTEPLASGEYNIPREGILSRAYSETNFVPGLLTSSMMYSENLPLASISFARGKDTDTEMLVFNTFNDLPIASKFQSETIMQGNELSSSTNNLDLSLSSMLHKKQLSSLRNLQPSMTQLNDVSMFVSNLDIFEIMSEGTPYVESTRSLLDSPLTENLKTARVELSSFIENVQGSQIISSQNNALTTSILVPTESLNAVFEPLSLPYSDKRVTDTLSSLMQTLSFKFSDSSNTLLYSLNSDKLNIESSFSTIQTISQGPMVEGNTFSVDTVLQSLYKGSSTIEDFGMEINSESQKPIYLTSNLPTTVGFSSSFPNTDTQRLLKQTELQPEFLLTSASVDVLSEISGPTNSVLYVSSSLVDGSPAFSSEVKMFSGETLQPLSIFPSSPIPDQHIPSVSNINQFTSPTSIDNSLTKTLDTDKLTSDSIVSSPFTAEAYSSNDENITASSHHANLYSDDLNSLSKVDSKQSMTSFHYLQNGNTPTLETPTAAFRLDTPMPYSSVKKSNHYLQKKSLSELPVYSDISNMVHSSTSNLTTNLELSSTLYNNSMFFTDEKFPIMKINKTDTFLGDRGVLTITDAPSSESSVDTFLFTAANDYDYYATDLDFVTDYTDATASSSKETLISMSSSKLPVKSILDDPISLLNPSQPVTVSLPVLPVSNSLEKQNVLAKAISGLPIVLPVQNETDIAKHKSTIISSQYYTDKHSSKATELVKETVEPSSQKYPKIDILPTPVITETEKPMTSSNSDIDMGMDYYDPFAAFFGGGDGGPAIPQWVIDMLGTVHDSPSSSAKYFRH
uniref:SEA domain-containing protein n=1 Tax=Magallana gigas TaxID=29159 RepID=A0A8W8IN95_MAGGI